MATQDIPVIRVLMALHPGMDTLDFTGPLEILSHAQHNINDASKLFNTSNYFLSAVAPRTVIVVLQGPNAGFVG